MEEDNGHLRNGLALTVYLRNDTSRGERWWGLEGLKLQSYSNMYKAWGDCTCLHSDLSIILSPRVVSSISTIYTYTYKAAAATTTTTTTTIHCGIANHSLLKYLRNTNKYLLKFILVWLSSVFVNKKPVHYKKEKQN